MLGKAGDRRLLGLRHRPSGTSLDKPSFPSSLQPLDSCDTAAKRTPIKFGLVLFSSLREKPLETGLGQSADPKDKRRTVYDDERRPDRDHTMQPWRLAPAAN